MTTHQLLRERLLTAAGLNEKRPPFTSETFESLWRSEWSVEFEHLMRRRLCMGALRYGKLGVGGKPKYDRIASIKKRLAAYQTTGNKEFLVDAANLLLLEFVECHHPLAHMSSLDGGHEFHVHRVGGGSGK